MKDALQPLSKDKLFTLITGGSLGIGRALAFECAGKGMNLILVALPGPELAETATKIGERYPVSILTLGIDLTEDDAPEKVYSFIKDQGVKINILINNAGFGTNGLFENSSLDLDFRMIQLNNMAMIGLIHYFIPELKKSSPSHILNMSSMEATLPLPYKSVYTGTKNFIYAYSLALNEELRPDHIRVSVLCPGPVITNEEGLRRYKAQGVKARLIIMMPDQVAKKAISAMLKGKTIIIPGFTPWLITKVINFLPELLKMRILERIFRVYKYIPTVKI